MGIIVDDTKWAYAIRPYVPAGWWNALPAWDGVLYRRDLSRLWMRADDGDAM